MTDRPRTSDVRKNIPLSVKLAVALRMLGFTKEDRVQFDHNPALGLRPWDPVARDFVPPQLDPDAIVILTKAAHRAKTGGRKGEKAVTSYGSDAHAIAKIDRVQEDQAAFRARILAKGSGEEPAAPPRKPRSTIPGRGFPDQHRPLQGRNNLRRRP